jgi:hypothetical protein
VYYTLYSVVDYIELCASEKRKMPPEKNIQEIQTQCQSMPLNCDNCFAGVEIKY